MYPEAYIKLKLNSHNKMTPLKVTESRKLEVLRNPMSDGRSLVGLMKKITEESADGCGIILHFPPHP